MQRRVLAICIITFLFQNNLFGMHFVKKVGALFCAKKTISDEKSTGIEVDGDPEKGSPASPETLRTMQEALAAFEVKIPCEIENYHGKLLAKVLDGPFGWQQKVTVQFNEKAINRTDGHLVWLCYYLAAHIALWEKNSYSCEEHIALACDMLIKKRGREGQALICIGILELLMTIDQKQQQLQLKKILTKFSEQGWSFDFKFKPAFDYLEIHMGVQYGSPDEHDKCFAHYPEVDGFNKIKELLTVGEAINIGSWNVHVGKETLKEQYLAATKKMATV